MRSLNLVALMQTIATHYHFHVYRSIRIKDGYRLETNCGPKRISVWTQEQHLHWSFLWREELAQKGFRQVDRFIRTRDGAPYVNVSQEYVVVQDILEGKAVPFDQPLSWFSLGNCIGLLFQSFRELAQRDYPHQKEKVFWKSQNRYSDPTCFHELKKRIVTLKDSMFIYLVKEHWLSLEKRWKQSISLQSVASSPIISLSKINIDEIVLLQQGCLGFSSSEEQVSFDHEGIAELLKDLHQQEGASLEFLEHFYASFQRIYQPTIEDQYNILSHLIYPKAFFEMIHKYLELGYSDQDCAEGWVDLCQNQEALDQLHSWYAERLDRRREDAVSL